jgi:hypothetical protein
MNRNRLRSIARRLLGPRYEMYAELYNTWRGRRKCFATGELRRSVRAMGKFENRYAGRRCVIIGNGPSLKKMDLRFLEDEVAFGLNRIYLLRQEGKVRIDFLVCVNDLVLEQSAEDILKVPEPKFLSSRSAKLFPPRDDVYYLGFLPGYGFSRDPRAGVWEGHTVTFVAMQLAYFMGFSEVVLIGVDHNFAMKGKPNEEILMDRDDESHFAPNYFPPGMRWHLPDLENSEIAYRIAKVAFERDGRRIFDATVGGQLQVFPKVDYRKHFAVK